MSDATAGIVPTIASGRRPASPRLTIALIALLFFVFGFVTWLNGPLITFVKLAFTLSDVEAFLVPSVFYMSYFFLALPAAAILRRTGMKRGMAIGLLIMAVGAAIFGQFTTMRWFGGALAGLFVVGSGLALLQTAVNPYISIVGPIESAAQRIAIMGICNKGAGILAPLVFGLLVMQGIDDLGARVAAETDAAAREALLDSFAQSVRLPYLAMAGVLALVAYGVLRSPLPELGRGSDHGAGAGNSRTLGSFSHLWFGAACLFFYMGAEVMAGDAIGTYGAGFGLPVEQTSYFTSLTLTGMLFGYVVGLLAIPRFISQDRYLALSAIVGIVLVVGAYLTEGYTSIAFVALLGFANAMMWPTIFPLAIRGLGRHTETGAAVLVMAISGGAIIPQLFAILKQYYDFQFVFMALMAPSYLYIFYFAIYGYRTGKHHN